MESTRACLQVALRLPRPNCAEMAYRGSCRWARTGRRCARDSERAGWNREGLPVTVAWPGNWRRRRHPDPLIGETATNACGRMPQERTSNLVALERRRGI